AFWGLWKYTNKITTRVACDPNREGDGSVPLASAQLEDVTIRYVQGKHGALPSIPAVAKDILAWLTNSSLGLAKTCEGALGGHLSAEDQTAAPLLSGPLDENRFRELPDYEHPSPEFRAEVEADLDRGRVPQINLVKIL